MKKKIRPIKSVKLPKSKRKSPVKSPKKSPVKSKRKLPRKSKRNLPRKSKRKSSVKSPKKSPVLSPRSREYKCFKIQNKNDCDKIDRCHWDDNWSIFSMFKNKCKSRLFHELKINYPVKETDFDKIRKRLYDLELKSETKELTNKEKQDLEVLLAFKDDFVTFDFNIRKKAEFLVDLKREYEIEKDRNKKEELFKKIKLEEQTTLQWIIEKLKTKEFIYFVFGVLMLATLGLTAVKILDYYERAVEINKNADSTYADNTVRKNESEVKKNESNTKWYKESGISGIMKSTAWLLAPIPTGIEYFKEGLGYFYKD